MTKKRDRPKPPPPPLDELMNIARNIVTGAAEVREADKQGKEHRGAVYVTPQRKIISRSPLYQVRRELVGIILPFDVIDHISSILFSLHKAGTQDKGLH